MARLLALRVTVFLSLLGLSALPLMAQQFANLHKESLPERVDRTMATVVGDVDRDGDLDLILGSAWQIRLYVNDGNGIYTDVTVGRFPLAQVAVKQLELADFDGDGDLDLLIAVSMATSAQSLLYLNTGGGTFVDATAGHLPVAQVFTTSIEIGDVDRDGDIDIVLGNNGQTFLYLNNGSAVFSDVTTSRMPLVGRQTGSLVLGDVDNDGDLDLILGNGYLSGADQSALYLNDGTGKFVDVTASKMPALFDAPRCMALVDVDRDADLDLIVVESGAAYFKPLLLVNDGSGKFVDGTATRLPTIFKRQTSLAVGDIDGDGDVDIVIGCGGDLPVETSVVLRNDGTGRFADATGSSRLSGLHATISVALADVDHDGDLDLVMGNGGSSAEQSQLWLNRGDGTFLDASFQRFSTVPFLMSSARLADVDRDGDLDVLLTTFDGKVECILNDGRGVFAHAPGAFPASGTGVPTCMVTGDLNGDGYPDVIVGRGRSGTTPGMNSLFLNSGNGRFTDATAGHIPNVVASTTALAFADVDADGDLDLVVGTDAGARLLINTGSGVFADATVARLPPASIPVSSIAIGDVDGDGNRDVLLSSITQASVYYRNTGTGTFVDATAGHLPAGLTRVRSWQLADVDNDGRPDLVIAGLNGGSCSMLANTGSGVFVDVSASRLPVTPADPNAIAIGDVDEDGDLDMITVYATGSALLLVNGGTGAFADLSATRMPAAFDNTVTALLGDLDGDGDLDLVLATYGAPSRVLSNLLRQTDTPHILQVGRPFWIDVYAHYGAPSAVDIAHPFMATGLARIALPPLGTLWLDPATLVLLPSFPLAQPVGTGSLQLQVPNDPALDGATIYTQTFLVRASHQDRFTNYVSDFVIR